MIALPLCGQQIIDRIVVVVNGQVITQSEWDQQERFEALDQGKPPGVVQHSQAALDRLIDHVLLLQQMAELNFRPPSAELVQQEMDDVKKQFPAAQTATAAAWAQTLRNYGLTDEDFKQIAADQANVTRFIDVRFRANTRITPFEVETYYKDSFLPEFQKASQQKPAPPLKEVQDRIQQILLEQRVTEGLTSFIQSLRIQAVIRDVAPMGGIK